MTEERASYMGQTANAAAVAPRTAMFSFAADGMDRHEMRRDVPRIVNRLVGTLAACFPGCRISRIVQFQVSEPWRLFDPEEWFCDVYVLAEIAPEPPGSITSGRS